MSEGVNLRLIEKIKENKLNKKSKQFIVEALREEFSHSDQAVWQYGEFYKSLVEKYAVSSKGGE